MNKFFYFFLTLERKKLIWILVLALSLFFLLTRLFKITSLPSSVYWDEASIGYNAYSVLMTGKDEWGRNFPIHFRAFGEFKLPTYIYSVMIFESFLGLSSWALRIPAVLYSLGTLTILFFLSLKLTKRILISFLATLLLITSPWFFLLTRIGYEANAGLMFFLLGIYLFFLSKRRSGYLILSTISFVISLYSYNSFRVVIPLILPAVFGIFFYWHKKSLRTSGITVLLSVVIIALSFIPVVKLYRYDAGGARLGALSIKNSNQTWWEVKGKFLENYFSHFSYKYLFSQGDHQPRFSQNGYGELFWFELPLLLVGLIYLFRNFQPEFGLLLLFLLAAPIPAALTTESPHAMRSLAMLPVLSLLASLGGVYLSEFFKRPINQLAIIGSLSLMFFLAFSGFYYDFLTNYNFYSSKDFQYGYKKISDLYQNQFSKYNQVIISDDYAQPYIFQLYYSKFNPGLFLKSVKYNSVSDWGFSTVRSFGPFLFPKQTELATINLPGSLIFSAKGLKRVDLKWIDRISFLDGSPTFWVYEQR